MTTNGITTREAEREEKRVQTHTEGAREDE